jgi:hypothetical protein
LSSAHASLHRCNSGLSRWTCHLQQLVASEADHLAHPVGVNIAIKYFKNEYCTILCSKVQNLSIIRIKNLEIKSLPSQWNAAPLVWLHVRLLLGPAARQQPTGCDSHCHRDGHPEHGHCHHAAEGTIYNR